MAATQARLMKSPERAETSIQAGGTVQVSASPVGAASMAMIESA